MSILTLSVSMQPGDNDPTTAEFRTGFKEAIQRLLTFKDDQGESLNNGASGLVAVVPPSMYVSALEALSATLLSSTTNVLQGAARVLTFPRLTATDKWYLMKTDVPVRAFIFQDREPIEFTAMERESESGFMREVYLYGVRARYKMTYGYWRHALQVTFVSSSLCQRFRVQYPGNRLLLKNTNTHPRPAFFGILRPPQGVLVRRDCFSTDCR